MLAITIEINGREIERIEVLNTTPGDEHATYDWRSVTADGRVREGFVFHDRSEGYMELVDTVLTERRARA